MRLLTIFSDGILMSLMSILIVFAILYLLTLSVSLIKERNNLKQEITQPSPSIVTIDDILDEDMMVAVLTASIDYRNECKTDVKLVSVKEITK